jgi:hypothetical protein
LFIQIARRGISTDATSGMKTGANPIEGSRSTNSEAVTREYRSPFHPVSL